MGGRPRFCLDSEWEGAESELGGGTTTLPQSGSGGIDFAPPPILAEKGLKRGTFAAPKDQFRVSRVNLVDSNF